jgi:lipoprotein NlpD
MACATPGPEAGGVRLEQNHEEPDLVSVHHVVAAGQNLYRIAKAYGLSADELAAANGISDPGSLQVGQDLVIPGATERASVEATGTAPEVEDERPGTVRAKDIRPAARDDPRRGTLKWPLRGVLYGRFGRKGKEAHDGIDLAAPTGTPVKAAADGTVLYAGEQRGYGRIVILEHDRQLVTLYAHNQALRVSAGEAVRAGQVIATVGESGRTTGPHLHFEVRSSGVPVNPLDYLGPVPAS